MDFFLKPDIRKILPGIEYSDRIMLTGSCFTEHIGNALAELKFPVMQNPNGILFGPDAVCHSLLSYLSPREYVGEDLFYLNEAWHSWDHHSRFSAVSKSNALQLINQSQQQAHDFLKNSQWLIITLGSSFSYHLSGSSETATKKEGDRVANCHRAPSAWFTKKMMETSEITSLLSDTITTLREFNPGLRIIFTISPVRHIRDGVVDNNRSKARLIESVHTITDAFDFCFYFPAYELVIDVLRDYRFYDIDLVHPNYSATAFVFEKFTEAAIASSAGELMQEVRKIVIAGKHRPFHPDTAAHREFLETHLRKAKALEEKYPFLDLGKEISFFRGEK